MSKIGSEIKPYLRILLALAWLFTSSAVAAADGCAPDEAVDTLSIPGRWRGFSTAAEEWLRFEVAAPAILTLDATAPLTALGDPVLTVLGPGCQTVTEDFTYLERSPAHQVIFVQAPGEYFVRVMTADLQQPLGGHKVTLGAGEPDPFSKDTEEIEIDPDGLGSGGGSGRDAAACNGEDDDHADTPSCATPLRSEKRAAGSLGNSWGDDSDVFELTLDEPAIVRIEAHSGTDTIGGLFDRDGLRLAVDDDGGDGEDFQIVRALVAGRYFLRVEGLEVGEQPYTLSLETRAW